MSDNPPSLNDCNDLKSRVEAIKILAESAGHRFVLRRTMEWQVGLAVWSSLGAIGIGVLQIKDTRLAESSGWFIVIACAGVALAQSLAWLPYINSSALQESRQRDFWECCLRELIREGMSVPHLIEPKNGFSGEHTDWKTLRRNAQNALAGRPIECVCYEKNCGWFPLHRASWVQIAISISLVVFVAVACREKCQLKENLSNPVPSDISSSSK